MKTYKAVIKGNDTDASILREILGDEFELVSLESETLELTPEQKLKETRKVIFNYLTKTVKLIDVQETTTFQLERDLCNQVLEEIKAILLQGEEECEDCECEVQVDEPVCPVCKKANPTLVYGETKYCDLMCVRKHIHG